MFDAKLRQEEVRGAERSGRSRCHHPRLTEDTLEGKVTGMRLRRALLKCIDISDVP